MAAGLFGHPLVDVIAEATSDLIVGVFHQVFGQVAGTLAPGDGRDHPRVRWHCGDRGRLPDRGVGSWEAWRVGSKCKSGKGKGGKTSTGHAGLVVRSLKGTVGIEVVHRAIDGFVHWR